MTGEESGIVALMHTDLKPNISGLVFFCKDELLLRGSLV